MKITDLDGAVILANALGKARRDFEIASNVGLLMMTAEEDGDQGKIVLTLGPPKDKDDMDDAEILFEALIDVMLHSSRRKIDRLTAELVALGVEVDQ